VTSEPEWVFVALGSNLGDRHGCLAFARSCLAILPDTSLQAVTVVEETTPIGPVPQGAFLNQMVLLRTALTPDEVLRQCQDIERDAGRRRTERWGPRTLDLDIVRFGGRRIDTPHLRVPHPELPNRPFWQRQVDELERVLERGRSDD
jgi:2-amino-4-hydroxy-6-hydroxymethyldihydropteridine diphosphokinase